MAGEERPALRWLKGYVRGTSPTIQGQANVTLSAAAAAGTQVATFTAADFNQAALPSDATVAWGIADAEGVLGQAIEFAGDGSGRLQLTGQVPAGTYGLRLFVDVNSTVSNLFPVQVTVQ